MAAADFTQRDALEDFERRELTFLGSTKLTFVAGSGPAVIVMTEMPGITPQVARFARTVRDAGFTVWMPSLFGEPGRPLSVPYTLKSVAKACIAREFRAFASNQSSPVTAWLRALAAHAHPLCGGRGVGAIGMCFTGNFALFGAAVASTDFFRGLNDEGQIAFTYQLATGEKGIALATPRDPAVLGNGEFDNGLALFEVIYGASDGFAFTPGGAGDPRLEMTTTTGVLGVRQPVQTGGGPYRLELEFDWLTAAGSLEVVANDVLVLTVGADASVASPVGTPQVDTLGDFTRVALELTPAALADPADGYVRLDLHPAGSEATIQLDGLSFAPLPEPAGAVLGCGAVAALGVLARQRPRRS